MKEKYNVILDTDIGNSWDDQFALVYLLKNDEMFNIEAITIAPFRHNEKESIIDNQELSYKDYLDTWIIFCFYSIIVFEEKSNL